MTGIERLLRAPQILYRRRRRYEAVFNTPDGQWVLRDILQTGMVGMDIMIPGDPYRTHYLLGQQRLAIGIVSKLNMSNERILKLTMESDDVEDED